MLRRFCVKLALMRGVDYANRVSRRWHAQRHGFRHTVRDSWRIAGRPWSEATIEAAPGSLTRIVWRRGRAPGSIGQPRSAVFHSREVARTGRKHNAQIVAQDVALLRECGIENINLDLIAGLPGQTEQSWRESILRLQEIDVPHASIYMLEVDEDTGWAPSYS